MWTVNPAVQVAILTRIGLTATVWPVVVLRALLSVTWAINSTIPYLPGQFLRPDRPASVVSIFYTTFPFIQTTAWVPWRIG
jgi:hypothetical protein